MTTTVTAKGQVAIPRPVREFLSIGPGCGVTFDAGIDRTATLRKNIGATEASRPPSRFARLRGSATAGMSTDEIMALTRGDA